MKINLSFNKEEKDIFNSIIKECNNKELSIDKLYNISTYLKTAVKYIDKKTITANSTFQDLGADSLDLLEIIMRLEEQFGIEINDEDAEKMNKMQDVVAYINERRTK